MNSRYVARVVKILDPYHVVINKGQSDGIRIGQKFTIVEIGELLIDPDTGNQLEALEIVKGKVEASHVQEKISTLKAYETTQKIQEREIKKTVSASPFGLAGFGGENTVVETLKPTARTLNPLSGIKPGDYIIKS